MGTITSANSQVILSVPDVFPSPIPIQGYAADDAFTQGAFDMAETKMGVDGILSAGYTPSPKPFDVMLQADSPSIDIFLAWKQAEEAAKEKFQGTIIAVLPSVSKQFTMSTVWLKNMQGMPSAKKVLEPIPVKMEAQDIFYSPI